MCAGVAQLIWASGPPGQYTLGPSPEVRARRSVHPQALPLRSSAQGRDPPPPTTPWEELPPFRCLGVVFLPWRNHVVLLWPILPPSLNVPICTMGI